MLQHGSKMKPHGTAATLLKSIGLSIMLGASLASMACNRPAGENTPSAIPSPTVPRESRPEPSPDATSSRQTIGETRQGRSPSVSVVAVGPAREECYGLILQMCLVVDGELWYDEIDGFHHEPG